MGKENMHYKFEDILSMVGDQNKWQIVIFLYTWIEGFLIGFHHLSSSYLGASDGHWCNIDAIDKISIKFSNKICTTINSKIENKSEQFNDYSHVRVGPFLGTSQK